MDEGIMRRVSRSNVVILSSAASIPACAKKREGPHADPKYVVASQSLQRLKADAQKLQAETAAIHKRLDQVEATADNLPGLAAFRSDLFATEEVLGGVGNTVEFLARELAAAFAGRDGQQIEKVTGTITSSADEMKKFEKSVVALSHGLIPFERTVAQFRALAAAGVFFTRVLPTGFEVRAANDGIEERLLAVVTDRNVRKKAARASWLATAPALDFRAFGPPLPGENKDPGLRNLAAGARLTPGRAGQQEVPSPGSGSRRSSGHGSDSIPGAPGGARGPAIAGASVISPRCRRIRRMAPGSITALTIRIRPWQRRHSSASTTNTLFSSSAQGRRYGDGTRSHLTS
jgi:hypothetical protein